MTNLEFRDCASCQVLVSSQTDPLLLYSTLAVHGDSLNDAKVTENFLEHTRLFTQGTVKQKMPVERGIGMQKIFRQYNLTTELAKKHSHSTYLASTTTEPERQVVLTVFASSLFRFPHERENLLKKAQRIKELEHPLWHQSWIWG